MSLLKGFNAQGGRPAAHPSADQGQPTSAHAVGDQPNWNPQVKPQTGGHGAAHTGSYGAQPAQQHQWPTQSAPAAPGYGNQAHGYNTAYPGAAQTYGQAGGSYGSLAAQPDPYAPSFEPYSAATPQAAPRANSAGYQAGYPAQTASAPAQATPAYGQQAYGQQAYGAPHAAASPQQWAPQPSARGFEAAGYPQPAQSQPPAYRQAETHGYDADPAHSDWQAQAAHQSYQNPQGYEYTDPNAQYAVQGDASYAQQTGEHDQGYAEDEAHDYELEEPGRARRPIMMAAALAGAILVGGGMAYGYKSFFGNNGNVQPPIVKSASAPSKTKPADAGGKQFAHSDSKIMGRLGDGAPAAGGASETDANGTRKVSTLVVGRDGSIQAPAAAPPETAPAPAAAPPTAPPAAPVATAPQPVGVPGMMVVDALGPKANAVAAAPAAPAAPQKIVVAPPAAAPAPAKPVVVAKADAATAGTTGSVEAQAAAPAAKKPAVPKKAAANDAFTTAVVAPAAAPTAAPVTSGNGYVAVLASVPLSGSSRTEALKRYADMQQKYGGILSGKTPDVTEANLGAKGTYHRLVVGPPASREQATGVCSQLKAQGYGDCWVTSY